MRRAILFLALGGLVGSAAEPAGSLTIRVDGLRNDVGTLRFALFRTAAGYPEDSVRAAATRSVPAALPAVEVRFDGLERGTWALAVLHDEDGDGRLDRNALGVPTEGIGASNDATRRLGPPLFDDARFELAGAPVPLDVTLKYWW